LSGRALETLKSVDTVVGYSTYIDLIHPVIQEKEIISTSMMKEVDRAAEAISAAMNGKSCAIVSSGDSGVYAMAGLVFEMCREKGIPIVSAAAGASGVLKDSTITIEVIPGIPALCAGASLLGAPLTHDFAAISLSDLLTPWETIERRIAAAAESGFVIVFYNPKSKKRDWQLEKAQQIILKHRDGKTPVGIVSRAMREDQSTRIVDLETLHEAPVDMQTIVFIGNSTTMTYSDFMITPRGYAKKYEMAQSVNEK
jgi:precorrin-3B C17-methyltransferase